jgi:hypothetical protein
MMARAMAKAAINQEADGLAKKRTALNATIKDIKFTYSESYDCDSLPAAGRRQRWIPNTGEYMVISGLRLEKAVNLEGAVRDLQRDAGDKYTINVTAIDRGYDADKAGNGNIYNNTEKSEFELIGIWNLWIFGKNINIGHLTLDAMQYADQGNAIQRKHYSYQAGNTPQGFRLDTNGAIQYHGSILTYDKIGIRPASHCNPGDDILLCLDMYDNKGNLLIRKPMEEKEYFAVYDKKMLWRANLYIDDEANDWNNLNNWNAPLDENDWNYGQGGDKEGKGGQFPLQAFSSPRTQSANNDDVSKHVAYDYPGRKTDWATLPADAQQCIDTPILFNQKMLQLKTYLAQSFNTNGDEAANVQANNAWDMTTAPKHRWSKYLKVAKNDRALPGLGLLYYDWANGQGNLDPDLKKDVVGTTGKAFHDDTAPYDVSPDHIGTDCVGLAKNSIMYPGTTYVWNSGIFRRYPSPNIDASLSTTIVTSDDPNQLQTENLKKIVPGDIFYYGGWENGKYIGHHIGIIQSTDGTGVQASISLIEAYFDGDICYANNTRTVQDLTDKNRAWEIVRLK